MGPARAQDDERQQFYEETLNLISEGRIDLAFENYLRLGIFGFERNDKASLALAEKLLEELAKAGHPQAQFWFANQLRSEIPFGETMLGTEVEAWYRSAAKQGNIEAQGELGQAQVLESSSQDNLLEGLMWLLIAQSSGNDRWDGLIETSKALISSEQFDEVRRRAEVCQSSGYQQCGQ
jgi:TPR repeat protein